MFRTQYGTEPPPRKPGPAKLVHIPSVNPGVRLEGWLYEPSAPTQALNLAPNGANGKLPLVLLFHGVGSRKDSGLQVLAFDLAEMAGVAALALDYRGFGGSGGTPRLLIDPEAHADDMVHVLKVAAGLAPPDPGGPPESDLAGRFDPTRIALLGCSLGGAVACAAALRAEREVGITGLRAVVSVAGAITSNTSATSLHAKTKEDQRYFDACVALDAAAPGTIFIPVSDTTQLAPATDATNATDPALRDGHGTIRQKFPGFPGARKGFERRCFLPGVAQGGAVSPPYLERCRDVHPPARGFALLRRGLASLKPPRACVAMAAALLHVTGEHDDLINPDGRLDAIRALLAKKRARGTVAEMAVLPCEHMSVFPLLNPDFFRWIQPWSAGDRRKQYVPAAYGRVATAIARFLAGQLGIAGGARAVPPWRGAGYEQMGLRVDLGTGLTRPLPGFEREYIYMDEELGKLKAELAYTSRL